ncbi:hypothetical protein B0H34DRAFT_465559 [Crassisporium funariophilum]|nr:hypothetical protein B0H34DRAFT_465559 [Crassisporium funariophilum]
MLLLLKHGAWSATTRAAALVLLLLLDHSAETMTQSNSGSNNSICTAAAARIREGIIPLASPNSPFSCTRLPRLCPPRCLAPAVPFPGNCEKDKQQADLTAAEQ